MDNSIPDNDKVPTTGYYTPSCCNWPHRLSDGQPRYTGKCGRGGRAFIVACYLKGL